jgi:hypothetical protein
MVVIKVFTPPDVLDRYTLLEVRFQEGFALGI